MRRIVGWSSNFVKSDPGTAKLMGKAFGKAPPVMSFSEDGETDLEAVIPAKPHVVIAQIRAQKSFREGGGSNPPDVYIMSGSQ